MSPPHISSKYWCTNATAIAPSPTAEATTHERRATGQVGHVAGELAASEHRQDRRRLARLVDDLDLAGHDDEELEVALADLDKLVAGPVVFERRSGAAPERGVLPVWRRLHPSGPSGCNTSIAQPTSAVGQGPIDRADPGD